MTPFTSIVAHNAAVFRDAVGAFGHDAVLEHHRAFEDEARRNRLDTHSRDKLKRASENRDAADRRDHGGEFFESLFAAKTWRCRKLHNIANRVVIFDEAQTMPLLRSSVAALPGLSMGPALTSG